MASDTEQLARAVGFEPTIPDLETGALGQAKLRPFRCNLLELVPGSRVERLFPEPQSGVLATELPQGWCAKNLFPKVPKNWCRWVDLNNRPSPYESAALAAELHRLVMHRGSPSWIRTTIDALKVRHPAVRRRGNRFREPNGTIAPRSRMRAQATPECASDPGPLASTGYF